MSPTEAKSATWAARDWAQAFVPYRRASVARGVFELTVTFPPFAAVWTAMLLASRHGQFWLSFALAPLAAGLLIRLFGPCRASGLSVAYLPPPPPRPVWFCA